MFTSTISIFLACTGTKTGTGRQPSDSEPTQESKPPQDTGPEGKDEDGDGEDSEARNAGFGDSDAEGTKGPEQPFVERKIRHAT